LVGNIPLETLGWTLWMYTANIKQHLVSKLIDGVVSYWFIDLFVVKVHVINRLDT